MIAASRFVLISALSLAPVLAVAPASALGQLVPTVENAKFGAAGVVNANSVAVHSGPGENYYPTTRLDKGATVTVVGVKFDWLKILPPDGRFSFVAKRFINKTGETAGTANGANVNVRAGSTLSPMKTAIQTQLQNGDPVEILGEVEEYYKIKPPAGAYLYVASRYVDAQKMLGPTDQLVKSAPSSSQTAGGTGSVAVTPPATPGVTTPLPPVTGTNGAAPQPTATGTVAVATGTGAIDPNAAPADRITKVAGTATTRPSAEVAGAMQAYEQAEQSFLAASQQPLDQQPLAQLTEAYTALASNDRLPASMRNNANARLQALKLRVDAQQDVLAIRKRQEEFEKRTAALEAERKALEAKLSSNRVLVYTAMGQLSTSSLKLGEIPVYRLVDPANGRTLVYIRGTDPSLGGMLNQFVGVKGDLVTDPQLSVSIITPTAVEPVDPASTSAAAAQIQPNSLKATASTSDK